MTNPVTLYLASTSPRRQELIRIFGLPVRIVANKADETIEPNWTPEVAVEQLSQIKAEAAFNASKATHKSGLLIGADTIVVLNNRILGKPQDAKHAHSILMDLQGNTHTVMTGVTILDFATGKQTTFHEETSVWMKALDEAQIERYIASGEPMDKAGAYGIQGIGSTLIQRIEGDYFNVVGLPLAALAHALEAFGCVIP